MENDRLKNIWKTSIGTQIDAYSNTELNAMMVKSAKESIRKLYPGWIIVGLCILTVAYLVWKVIAGNEQIAIVVFYLALLCITIVSLVAMLYSLSKMKKYNFSTSVTAWIKYRIEAIDRSIRLKKKYTIYVYLFVICILVAFNLLKIYILHRSLTHVVITAAIELAAVISVLCVSLQYRNKRYVTAREHLQSLYDEVAGE
ncbi:MAG: hypothetical protein LBG19_02785 [Prevotellaceae bacterium]|jgi:hypothetical protein|nr:hypothetical protein [Prevotellaceae bacterium]